MKLKRTWNNIRDKINRINIFITHDIWLLDKDEFGKAKAKAVKYLKVAIITAKDFGNERLGWQAASMSYYNAMAFIPAIAVIFAVTSGFGLTEMLRELIYQNFSNPDMVQKILGYADNIIASSRQGIYGIISFLFFVWLVIWLMLCVERAFNTIWKVEKSRVAWKRIATYFGILILSPFIIIIFLTMIPSILSSFSEIDISIPFFSSVSKLMSWVIFYAVATLLFSLMFKVIPNAKVKYSEAFKAAMLTGLAFTVVQYLYLETQILVSRLNGVYGAFAALPLFMVWLNIGWFIILIGCELTYAFQNVDSYSINKIKFKKKR